MNFQHCLSKWKTLTKITSWNVSLLSMHFIETKKFIECQSVYQLLNNKKKKNLSTNKRKIRMFNLLLKVK